MGDRRAGGGLVDHEQRFVVRRVRGLVHGVGSCFKSRHGGGRGPSVWKRSRIS
jgi:hypothetical protein